MTGLAVRARFVGRFLLAGVAVGAAGVGAAVAAGWTVVDASETAFALAALVFGFALLGWSGSVLAGRGIENLQAHLRTGSDWSEADSRRAMTVLGSLGGGGMVGASLATVALQSLG